MGESAQHQQLVNMIITTVKDIVGANNSSMIASDAADGYELPPITSEGFRPDVYYMFKDLLIIGEAKTSMDVSREHSKQQYRSYLRKCSLFHGRSMLIVAVPWIEHAEINNILKREQKVISPLTKIVILDGVGGSI